MITRKLGSTGIDTSLLGFGAMRLPMVDIGDKSFVDIDLAVDVIQHAMNSGITYLDTAFMYCAHESEVAVGKAIRGYRDKITLTSKCAPMTGAKPVHLRRMLEHQLRKLDVDYLDFYCFHGIGLERFHTIDKEIGWIKEMEQAHDEGLVKNISFSFHDDPENMKKLVDLGMFKMVTCQYNYMDQANAESMQYAHEKGLAVVVMGPVGGGRLAGIPKFLEGKLTESMASGLAVRFVASNPHVSVVLSGMGSKQMVDENIAAVNLGLLNDDETAMLNSLLEETKDLANLYCTGCGYCMPCPQGVNIPARFDAMNAFKVYGFEQQARNRYKNIMKRDTANEGGGICVECGVCLDKCPQNIAIIDQLKEVEETLSS